MDILSMTVYRKIVQFGIANGIFPGKKKGYTMKFSTLLMTVAAAGLLASANAQLAKGGAKFLGNITTNGQIRSDMGTYWNQITPENGCKWGSIHSLSNGNSGTSKFAWDNYDKCYSAYTWAKEKPGERHFKFHALVWGSQYPSFLCKAKNPGITVEKTKQYITEWFDAVKAKFPDLEYIDVVNEAIYAGSNYHSGYKLPATGAEGVSTDDKECGGSYIIEALGGDRVVNGKHQYDFITTAFKMARERWPKAVLIYNDYNTLSWQMNEGIELVQTILKNGAPVDAYGQQAHDCKNMSANDFASKLTTIHQKTGLPLFITEYDIGEADDEKQKTDFANQIPFMWETPWIAGITIWGYINGSTWRQNTGIMTSGGQDRKAMTWLKQYFAQNLNKGQNTTDFSKPNGGTTVSSSASVTPSSSASATVPQAPYGKNAIPGKIEIEDYDVGGPNVSYYHPGTITAGDYRTDDIGVVGGGTGHAIAYTSPNEWLKYTVTPTSAGNYDLVVRAAAGQTSFGLKIYSNDKLLLEKTVSVAEADQGWNSYVDHALGRVSVSSGKQVIKVVIDGYVNLDYISFTKVASTASSSSATQVSSSSASPAVVQKPFKGVIEIPGRMEMENYDIGGEGVAYHHPSPSTENISKTYREDDVGIAGGSIAYTAPNEWLEYTVKADGGEYDVVVGAATGSASFGLKIYSDDKLLLETTVDVAEDDQGWTKNIDHALGTVTLADGEQVIKVVITGYVNLDYMDFTKVVPPEEKRKPYNDLVANLPGKIEVEYFDEGGEGITYHDTDEGNNACDANSTECNNLREGTGVDLKKTASGAGVIGWFANDEWLEYTVNVTKEGDYTLYVAAASSNGGKVKFSFTDENGKVVAETEDIDVSGANAGNEDAEEDYSEYAKTKGVNVKLPVGKVIVRMTCAQQWIDVDYFNLVYGENAKDNAEIGQEVEPEYTPVEELNNSSSSGDSENEVVPGASSSSEASAAILADRIHMHSNTLQDYDVFDMQGHHIGRMSAYGMAQAISTLQGSQMVKTQGVYFIRAVSSGYLKQVRVIKK